MNNKNWKSGKTLRKEKMEKYEKPIMEIVELNSDVILTSGCSLQGGSEGNEGPIADCGIDF